MDRLTFTKYTASGNHFVIVDELDGPTISESQMPRLAFSATNPYFGVGADNLLVIQRCDARTLKEINDAHGYWRVPPSAERADMIFRMFEPNGEEAFCCGNGLMCIASYLFERHGIQQARMMTEVPLADTSVVAIGVDPAERASWVDLGAPRHSPERLVARDALRRDASGLDRVDDLEIRCRRHELEPYHDEDSVTIGGYLVFTGEPHLVVFPSDELADSELGGTFFSASTPHVTSTSGVCRRVNYGTWLLGRIGSTLNRGYGNVFPDGINVNLVRVDEAKGLIEYRCFERGIERETLACGTGALACAYVTRTLGRLPGDAISVVPHRCRWYEPNAVIRADCSDTGEWTLHSTPRLVYEGVMNAAFSTPSAIPRPAGMGTRADVDAADAA